MKLESNYIKTEALGATYDPFKGEQASDFGWVLNLPKANRAHNSQYGCGSRRTGAPYTGGLTNYPCTGSPPASSGGGAVYDFFRRTFLPQPGPSGPVAPSSSFSPTSMMLPAVAVVGVVGLLLILKKKK
jgi:hypothetical protein